MLDKLPVLIDPLRFSEKRKTLSGSLEVNTLTRLSEMLLDHCGEVKIIVSFDKEGRVPVIKGKIKVSLVLQCQLCLGKLSLLMDKQFKLGVVMSLEQADRLPSDCEPFILENEKILLNELIEDELLLALPDFPKHQYNCHTKVKVPEVILENNEQINSNNPFSILTQLKNTGD